MPRPAAPPPSLLCSADGAATAARHGPGSPPGDRAQRGYRPREAGRNRDWQKTGVGRPLTAGSDVQPAPLHGVAHQVRPAREAELLQRPGLVGLHRLELRSSWAAISLLLKPRAISRTTSASRSLSSSSRLEPRPAALPAKPPRTLARQRRVEIGAARRDRADARGSGPGRGPLQHVARGARLDELAEIALVLVRRSAPAPASRGSPAGSPRWPAPRSGRASRCP